jgi:hypothetical protein
MVTLPAISLGQALHAAGATGAPGKPPGVHRLVLPASFASECQSERSGPPLARRSVSSHYLWDILACPGKDDSCGAVPHRRVN